MLKGQAQNRACLALLTRGEGGEDRRRARATLLICFEHASKMLARNWLPKPLSTGHHSRTLQAYPFASWCKLDHEPNRSGLATIGFHRYFGIHGRQCHTPEIPQSCTQTGLPRNATSRNADISSCLLNLASNVVAVPR